MLRLLISPIIIGVGFYFYFFLKRAYNIFFEKEIKRKIKTIFAAISCLIAAFCFNVSGMYVVSVLHIMGISALFLLFDFILKKMFSEKYKNGFIIWKKLGKSGALAIVLTFALLVSGYFNMHNVVKTDYTVYTEKNIRGEGYKIALLADVHFGVTLDENELEEVCLRVGKEEPDVVILCGDIVDDKTTKEGVETVFKKLGKIKSKYGVFYVYGNHDRPFSMVSSEYTENDLKTAIESNGIKILKDEVFEINDDFAIIGRDDKGFDNHQRKSINELSELVDEKRFILTLDHRPCEYEENGKEKTNLLLSGHTHGGQLFPVNFIDTFFKINDLNYGCVEIDSDTYAIVTSGVAGWAYPVKTSAPSEYVVINVMKK